MHRLVVTFEARLDIDDILTRSRDQFGDAAVDRYRRLIDRALNTLVADPSRHGVSAEPGLPDAVRLYPLRIANSGTARSDRVSRPRHVLAFSHDAETVRILRVLHDRMDVERHLSGD